MALTNVGFDGTVNEAGWAALTGILGRDYAVAGPQDFLVSAGVADRTVVVAPGSAVGRGVLTVNSAPVNVTSGIVASGSRWDTIVIRRDWATNSASIIAVAGGATRAVSGSLVHSPGTATDDQILAIVQYTAGSTAPTTIVDMRTVATTPFRFVGLVGDIPAGDLVEGMTAYEYTTNTWKGFDGGTWITLNDPNNAKTSDSRLRAVSASSTNFGPIATSTGWFQDDCKVTFTAPPSGRVKVTMTAACDPGNPATIGYTTFRIYSGTDVLSGSRVVVVAESYFRSIGFQGASAILSGGPFLVAGLTPGAVYTAVLMHRIVSTTGDKATFNYDTVMVEPAF